MPHIRKGDTNTATPIKHVIVIVGENRSFDHIFATYVPKPGETVNNLLSEGIVNPDGTPGANYARATQFSADMDDLRGGKPWRHFFPHRLQRFRIEAQLLQNGWSNLCRSHRCLDLASRKAW